MIVKGLVEETRRPPTFEDREEISHWKRARGIAAEVG
jgi:hypothetical protein